MTIDYYYDITNGTILNPKNYHKLKGQKYH